HVNRQGVPWRLLHDAADGSRFAEEAEKSHLSIGSTQTAVSQDIQVCIKLLETNAFEGRLRRIDLSGDGRNNSGIAPATARDAALARHITVNGLPILDGDFGLGDYYSAFVAGGDDAFVIVANTYKD